MRILAILLCGPLAACSQTGSPQTASAAQKSQNAKPAAYAAAQTPGAVAGNCEQAVAKMQKQQMNAAMLGGALSMAGGLGGFAGRGGAVAAQAASVGGSVMQAKAQNDAQDAIAQECMP